MAGVVPKSRGASRSRSTPSGHLTPDLMRQIAQGQVPTETVKRLKSVVAAEATTVPSLPPVHRSPGPSEGATRTGKRPINLAAAVETAARVKLEEDKKTGGLASPLGARKDSYSYSDGSSTGSSRNAISEVERFKLLQQELRSLAPLDELSKAAKGKPSFLDEPTVLHNDSAVAHSVLTRIEQRKKEPEKKSRVKEQYLEMLEDPTVADSIQLMESKAAVSNVLHSRENLRTRKQLETELNQWSSGVEDTAAQEKFWERIHKYQRELEENEVEAEVATESVSNATSDVMSRLGKIRELTGDFQEKLHVAKQTSALVPVISRHTIGTNTLISVAPSVVDEAQQSAPVVKKRVSIAASPPKTRELSDGSTDLDSPSAGDSGDSFPDDAPKSASWSALLQSPGTSLSLARSDSLPSLQMQHERETLAHDLFVANSLVQRKDSEIAKLRSREDFAIAKLRQRVADLSEQVTKKDMELLQARAQMTNVVQGTGFSELYGENASEVMSEMFPAQSDLSTVLQKLKKEFYEEREKDRTRFKELIKENLEIKAKLDVMKQKLSKYQLNSKMQLAQLDSERQEALEQLRDVEDLIDTRDAALKETALFKKMAENRLELSEKEKRDLVNELQRRQSRVGELSQRIEALSGDILDKELLLDDRISNIEAQHRMELVNLRSLLDQERTAHELTRQVGVAKQEDLHNQLEANVIKIMQLENQKKNLEERCGSLIARLSEFFSAFLVHASSSLSILATDENRATLRTSAFTEVRGMVITAQDEVTSLLRDLASLNGSRALRGSLEQTQDGLRQCSRTVLRPSQKEVQPQQNPHNNSQQSEMKIRSLEELVDSLDSELQMRKLEKEFIKSWIHEFGVLLQYVIECNSASEAATLEWEAPRLPFHPDVEAEFNTETRHLELLLHNLQERYGEWVTTMPAQRKSSRAPAVDMALLGHTKAFHACFQLLKEYGQDLRSQAARDLERLAASALPRHDAEEVMSIATTENELRHRAAVLTMQRMGRRGQQSWQIRELQHFLSGLDPDASPGREEILGSCQRRHALQLGKCMLASVEVERQRIENIRQLRNLVQRAAERTFLEAPASSVRRGPTALNSQRASSSSHPAFGEFVSTPASPQKPPPSASSASIPSSSPASPSSKHHPPASPPAAAKERLALAGQPPPRNPSLAKGLNRLSSMAPSPAITTSHSARDPSPLRPLSALSTPESVTPPPFPDTPEIVTQPSVVEEEETDEVQPARATKLLGAALTILHARRQEDLIAMGHKDRRNALAVLLARRDGVSFAEIRQRTDRQLVVQGIGISSVSLGLLGTYSDLQITKMSEDDRRSALLGGLNKRTGAKVSDLQKLSPEQLLERALVQHLFAARVLPLKDLEALDIEDLIGIAFVREDGANWLEQVKARLERLNRNQSDDIEITADDILKAKPGKLLMRVLGSVSGLPPKKAAAVFISGRDAEKRLATLAPHTDDKMKVIQALRLYIEVLEERLVSQPSAPEADELRHALETRRGSGHGTETKHTKPEASPPGSALRSAGVESLPQSPAPRIVVPTPAPGIAQNTRVAPAISANATAPPAKRPPTREIGVNTALEDFIPPVAIPPQPTRKYMRGQETAPLEPRLHTLPQPLAQQTAEPVDTETFDPSTLINARAQSKGLRVSRPAQPVEQAAQIEFHLNMQRLLYQLLQEKNPAAPAPETKAGKSHAVRGTTTPVSSQPLPVAPPTIAITHHAGPIQLPTSRRFSLNGQITIEPPTPAAGSRPSADKAMKFFNEKTSRPPKQQPQQPQQQPPLSQGSRSSTPAKAPEPTVSWLERVKQAVEQTQRAERSSSPSFRPPVVQFPQNMSTREDRFDPLYVVILEHLAREARSFLLGPSSQGTAGTADESNASVAWYPFQQIDPAGVAQYLHDFGSAGFREQLARTAQQRSPLPHASQGQLFRSAAVSLSKTYPVSPDDVIPTIADTAYSPTPVHTILQRKIGREGMRVLESEVIDTLHQANASPSTSRTAEERLHYASFVEKMLCENQL